MRVDDFDFFLPESLIAQEPAERGRSRLLVLDRRTGRTTHTSVAECATFFGPGDLLVVNDTRVFPARLLGRRLPGGGAVEVLLLQRLEADRWDALVHPGHKMRVGRRFVCEGDDGELPGEILEEHTFGRRTIRFGPPAGTDVDAVIDAIGHVPLPPYIKRDDRRDDRERYQTIFARHRGSVAAPTAGLHFTDAMLAALEARGVERVAVTLHVGYGTFKPVRVEDVEAHVVDPEWYSIPPASAAAINAALDGRRRVVVVGTTTTRAVESAAIAGDGRVRAGSATTSLYIHPGVEFRVAGALFTNFHLPKSSLLMLVAAFAGRDHVLAAYREAVEHGYRFYSYGDAMLVV